MGIFQDRREPGVGSQDSCHGLCHAAGGQKAEAPGHALTFVEVMPVARLVELEVAGLVSQPQVVGTADCCLGAWACLHHTQRLSGQSVR